MMSPVGSIVMSTKASLENIQEIQALIREGATNDILRGIFHSYYQKTDSPIVIDNNRMWSAQLPTLVDLFPDLKMIITVRNPAWIINSLEKITRKDDSQKSRIRPCLEKVEDRAAVYMARRGIIGRALLNLRHALANKHSHRVLIIDYDLLCEQPQTVLAEIYSFCDFPAFSHDFQNVQYEHDAFDTAAQTPGLHRVSGAVKEHCEDTILPMDLFAHYAQEAFWENDLETNAKKLSP